MKKVLFLLGLFTLCATVTFAQDRSKAKAKVAKKPAGWVEDSLLWVKKPVGTAPIKSPRDAASGQATGKRQHKPRRPKPGGN